MIRMEEMKKMIVELEGLKRGKWKGVVEKGIEYIEERHHGGYVGSKEGDEGIVDFIRFLVHSEE